MSGEPQKRAIGIVIKADGTVPFDDDVPEENRAHMIAHLVDAGHQLDLVPGTRHVKVRNWKKPQG